jgi:endonuclease G
MAKRLMYQLLFLFVSCILYGCNNSSSAEYSDLYVIEPQTLNSAIINYEGYNVSYNDESLIPNWVSYELLSVETDGQFSRKGKKFVQDPELSLRQAENDDYRNSGWSRGHMAPAADFKWSEDAMNETFFFTNCCPQDESLNAGQWSTLEKKTRDCANKYGRVLVITGPIIGENINGTIGANKVVVPDAFFKALMTDSQAIAFVMYNTSTNENMQKCAMSVDRLEEITGLDFFPEVDDELENHLESTYTLKYWGL